MTRYGRWTVIGSAPAGANFNKRVVCVCDCGAEKIVYLASLQKGASKSCGCLRDELAPQREVSHGHARKGQKSAEYRIWSGMITRCCDSNSTNYPGYGGRGIAVCDRWRFGDGGATPFECFLDDMGPRPSTRHSIERERNNGNYEPSNCRWATSVEQSRNTRRNRIVEIDGVSMPLAEAIERFGVVKPSTIHSRLHYGWPVAAALRTPARAVIR